MKHEWTDAPDGGCMSCDAPYEAHRTEYAEVWCSDCPEPATGPDALCDPHRELRERLADLRASYAGICCAEPPKPEWIRRAEAAQLPGKLLS